MGLWNYYFIAKFYLYFAHYMGFHLGMNLVFALFLLLPLHGTSLKTIRLETIRNILALPAGFCLFYYDTWFPPFYRILEQRRAIEDFSGGYLLELAGRFLHPLVVLTVLGLLTVSAVAAHKFRLSTFVVLTLLAGIPLYAWWSPFFDAKPAIYQAPVSVADNVQTRASVATWIDNGVVPAAMQPLAHPQDQDLDAALQGFYQEQAARVVRFQPGKAQDVPFDLIVLQVCSLSWDDLRFSGEDHHPLYSRFDFLFTRFNSAASYSGPAAIRLLRGSCGQTSHAQLYVQDRPVCHEFSQWAAMGFTPQWLMNHDGRYGGFLNDIQQRGGVTVAPEDSSQAAVALKAFDGTPIRRDYAVLSAWAARRQQQSPLKVALYYNTISLHDGNHYPNEPAYAGTGKTYPQRLHVLLEDVNHFLDDLEHSGRKAVVVVVSEHGANARGDRMQIPFMREIPGPSISLVPLGISLIGLPSHPPHPLLITRPSSYTELSQLLAELVHKDPFNGAQNEISARSAPDLQQYIEPLGSTPFVTENEDIIVMRYGNRYFIRYKNSGWTDYQM